MPINQKVKDLNFSQDSFMKKYVSNFEAQIGTDPEKTDSQSTSRIVYKKTCIQTRVQIIPDHGLGDYEFIKHCLKNGHIGLFGNNHKLRPL